MELCLLLIRMRTLLAVFVITACSAWAQSNTFTIRNVSGSNRTNVPVRMGRPFLDGEIAAYPQVVCGGTPLTTQANVKKRHGSGDAAFALVSFLLPSINSGAVASCSFQNQASGNTTALTKTAMLDAGYDFDAVMELTSTCSGCSQGTQTYSARDALTAWDGSADAPYVGPVWKWAPGSVAQTIVFGDHANGSSDIGWQQTNAMPLTAALSITSGVTTYRQITVADTTNVAVPSIVRISAVNNHDETSTPQSEDIRVCSKTATVLTVCGVSNVTVSGTTVTVTTAASHGVRDGQRVTVAEVNRTSPSGLWPGVNGYWTVTVTSSTTFTYTSASAVSATYASGGVIGRGWNDSTVMGGAAYGLDINGNPAGLYLFPNTWTDPPSAAYKPFRPVVQATFWPTINKVHVRFVGEVADSEKWGDLVYGLVLKTGDASPATVYSSSTDRGEQIFHRAGSRWTKEFWIGGDPPAMEIDHNLEYLKATRWSWNFDTNTARNSSLSVPSAAPAEFAAVYSDNLHDIYDFANLEKSQGSPSLDDQDGPVPQVHTAYLRTFSATMKAAVFGMADLGASWYTHFREGASGKRITRPAAAGCPGQCEASGKGHVLSVTDRPQHYSRNVKLQGSAIPSASRITIPGGVLGSATTTGGFRLGFIHLFEPFSVPYMLTGDFFYLEELWFWAGYGAAYSYAANDTQPYSRGPLTLGYGVSGVPGIACTSTNSTLAAGVDSAQRLIKITSKWTGPSSPTYVSMVQPQIAGKQLAFVSSNAADTMSLYLEGEDATGATQNETIALNGTTVVTTSRTNWISLHGFKFTGGTPAGTVTATFVGVTGALIQWPGPATPNSWINHPLGTGVSIKSSSTSDTSARFDVVLFGTRTGSSALVTETLSLNGTTAVSSSYSDWNRVYGMNTVLDGASTDSLTFGTISVLRPDNAVIMTRGNSSLPVPAQLTPGGAGEERIRIINVDVASKMAVVERGVSGSAKTHSSGATFRYETVDTNNWEIRSTGWYLRLLAAAAFMSPDDSAEGSYFTSIARDQVASIEGQRDIAASAADASYSAVWNWSNTTQSTVGQSGAVRSCGGVALYSPLGIYDRGGTAFTQGWPVQDQALIYGINKSLAYESTGGFPMNYVAMGLGRVEELSVAPATASLNWMATFYNGAVNAAGSGCANCPYTIFTSGRYPVTLRSTGDLATTFSQLHSLYDDGTFSGVDWQGRTSFPTTSAYPCISAMALSFVADKTGGAAAETWLSANLRDSMTWWGRPLVGSANTCATRWSIAPRSTAPGLPTIITTSLPPGQVSAAYSVNLNAIGGVAPYTWNVSAGALCGGLSLAANGTLSGTPTTNETCNFTARVVDGGSDEDTQALSLTINPASGNPVITTVCPVTPAVLNQAYGGYQLAATGGTAPYTWALANSTTLPSGMSLSTGGYITGTPTATGTTTFDFTVTDDASATDTLTSCTIEVTSNNPPSITASPSAILTYSVSFSGSYEASGDPTITYAVTVGSLPPGMSLSSAGTLSGTPTTIGSFPVTVCATNAAGSACAGMTYAVRPSSQGLDVTALVSSTSALVTVRMAGLDANTVLTLVARDDAVIEQSAAVASIPAGLASRQYVLTGLLAGKTYHFDVGGGGYGGTFSIATPASGTSNNAVEYQVSCNSTPGTTHLRVRYGGTSALGSTSSIAACSGGMASVSLTRDSGPLWIADDRCADGACITVLVAHPAVPFMIQ